MLENLKMDIEYAHKNSMQCCVVRSRCMVYIFCYTLRTDFMAYIAAEKLHIPVQSTSPEYLYSSCPVSPTPCPGLKRSKDVSSVLVKVLCIFLFWLFGLEVVTSNVAFYDPCCCNRCKPKALFLWHCRKTILFPAPPIVHYEGGFGQVYKRKGELAAAAAAAVFAFPLIQCLKCAICHAPA